MVGCRQCGHVTRGQVAQARVWYRSAMWTCAPCGVYALGATATGGAGIEGGRTGSPSSPTEDSMELGTFSVAAQRVQLEISFHTRRLGSRAGGASKLIRFAQVQDQY